MKEKISLPTMLLLMSVAYMFSLAIRMIWVYQFQDDPNFYWNGQLMINTNDGYTWAASAQNVLFGMHEHNPELRDMWANGIIAFTVLFAKITPFSLETVILYMPAIVSSLVVIPMILIARLYKRAVWGFFAALLGSIAWSYYNRTMTGYYDTDMFSAMAPMFILYFLMKSTMDFTPRAALYAAIAIALYPFLYDAGKSIVYAMGIIYALYMMFYHRDSRTTYVSMVLVFVALIPFPLAAPFSYLVKIAVLIIMYYLLRNSKIGQKKLMIVSSILFLLFMYFGNVFGLILGKVMSYISTGTASEGLHFYGVKQTIREAGQIPFKTFANRISGSTVGVIISLIGYIVLVMRHKTFILALPLIGIGVFALWGGLRFTVYAVPVAAMSAIYLFHFITTTISDKKSIYVVAMTILTAAMIYPNIVHIIGYKVPTVLNKAEVQDLEALNKMASDKDYTLTWWDYGYPIWFYSDTNTIIDGGKHQNDNFIISKIMQTSSPEFAANLSRLAVETYVDSNYSNITNTLFKNGEEDQLDPNLLLSELEDPAYELPKSTRDIYLYLPYRMLRILPTVAVFGNLDLTTGKSERKISFYPTSAVGDKDGVVSFRNGITFDMKKGEVSFGQQKKQVKNFIITRNTKEGNVQLQSQLYHADGEYAIVYMKSYNIFVVMDVETFNSMYVQMFMLEKYDKNLFELVVSSPYSKIYKLKQ
jgi:dolichyl-diphosphooligosaccharide--protein glycosyltransferase/undecaprenyl-diphosphooligosaccharide--protein glycosyltransferase